MTRAVEEHSDRTVFLSPRSLDSHGQYACPQARGPGIGPTCPAHDQEDARTSDPHSALRGSAPGL